MKTIRATAVFAFATTLVGSAVSLTLAAPIAHADPLDEIRSAVNGTRSGSTCQPLTYSVALEGEAQAITGNKAPGLPPTGQYKGTFQTFINSDDPESAATNGAVIKATGAIKDCSYKDFGVGFSRYGDLDSVAVALGKPPEAPPPPPPPAAPPPPPPPAVPPPPVNCPGGTSVPAGQTCPVQPVTDAISLSFSHPNLGSIEATVSNSSDLNGKCTYDATPFNTHRDFNVPAHGSTPLSFSGLNTGTNYHATVTCKDASGKQTQPIGTASQDVRF